MKFVTFWVWGLSLRETSAYLRGVGREEHGNYRRNLCDDGTTVGIHPITLL